MRKLISLPSLLFFLLGAATGLFYYIAAGLPLSVGAWISALCVGLIVGLFAEFFFKERNEPCNT